MKITSTLPRRRSRIVIIPLIDIMFFLLAAFMMVSLQMSRTANIQLNLPPAGHGQQDFNPDMIHIAVDKAGEIWFEKKRLLLPELGLVLSNRLRLNVDMSVCVSGDRDTLHGPMADVLRIVRGVGVQKVAFAVGAAESQTRP